MTRELVIRQGYMKFWRLGSIEFGKQGRWARAPRNKGMWAFPYPYYDSFFTYHKYADLMPKSVKDSVSWEEMEQWVKTVGRKVLPIREFWYKGDVFTHFLPNGWIGDTGLFNAEDTDWSVMDTTTLGKFIVSSGGNKTLHRIKEDAPLERIRTSVDHLEVFIAPGMGQIRDKL